jgi:hypothetical protein
MADLRDSEVHTIMARRTVLDEVDPQAASAANARIAAFDNAISQVACGARALLERSRRWMRRRLPGCQQLLERTG